MRPSHRAQDRTEATLRIDFRNYDTEKGPREKLVTGGLPQGSVVVDYYLRQVLKWTITRGVTRVAFADDICLVIARKFLQDIQNLLQVTVSLYSAWIDLSG